MTTCDAVVDAVAQGFGAACRTAREGEWCIVSLPLHLQTGSGDRVEVAFRQVGTRWEMTDLGKTLGELLTLGINLRRQSKAGRLDAMIDALSLVREGIQLKRVCDSKEALPLELWGFAEALKDVSGLALTHTPASLSTAEIAAEIQLALIGAGAVVEEGKAARVEGAIESHQLDMVGSLRNTSFGIAILGSANTKRLAESWAFRFMDMNGPNPDLRRIAVFDDQAGAWPAVTRRVLAAHTEAILPASEVGGIVRALAA